jgi:hypothetical protein
MIGYYVHHHGSGHLHRLRSVSRHLRSSVTVLSSLQPSAGWDGPWVHLDRDDATPPSAEADVDASGAFHWAPLFDVGLRTRARQLLEWVDRTRPSLVVVDVSVEVSTLVRLAGVPVVVMAMPGVRTDRAHLLGYEIADAIIAPWPRGTPNGWSSRWDSKTHHVGAFSRFDGCSPAAPVPSAGPRAVLMSGAGGQPAAVSDIAGLRAATPGWSWVSACGGHQLDGPGVWRALCEADVVVTHGGQNAVAEVAAARVPAVVVAEPRPFDEQVLTTRALDQMGIAVGLESWPDHDRWPELLGRARGMGGQAWGRWSTGQGARRVAELLDGLAEQGRAVRSAEREPAER